MMILKPGNILYLQFDGSKNIYSRGVRFLGWSSSNTIQLSVLAGGESIGPISYLVGRDGVHVDLSFVDFVCMYTDNEDSNTVCVCDIQGVGLLEANVEDF